MHVFQNEVAGEPGGDSKNVLKTIIYRSRNLDFPPTEVIRKSTYNDPSRIIIASGKLPTYPSPEPTLTLTSHLRQNVALAGRGGGGVGGQFHRNIRPGEGGVSKTKNIKELNERNHDVLN